MDNKKIAVLIDAENISYKNTRQIIDTMSAKGDVIIKEIIADWTKIAKGKISGGTNDKLKYREKQIDGWRKEASQHSMTAVQQFSYVSGKNTSDMALTIQAMKILYEKPFIGAFCIVSNDSDFTRLAQELREQNKEVVGMGERNKAIPEFVNAFSEFIYLGEAIEETAEVAVSDTETAKTVAEIPVAGAKAEAQVKSSAKKKPKRRLEAKPECVLPATQLKALKTTIEEILSEHDGIAYYSLISLRMKQQFPDFVPANYECRSISALIDKLMPFLPEFIKHKEPMANNPNGWIMMLKGR